MQTMTVSKSDCMTVVEAAKVLGISRSTFYKYSKFLGVTNRKFPFDQKAYVLRSDVERVKKLAEESKE